MLREEYGVFAADYDDNGNVDTVKMKIKVKDDIPCKTTYNSIPRPVHQELKYYIEDLLSRKWITNSHSEYSSSVVGVKKRLVYFGYAVITENSMPIQYQTATYYLESLGTNHYFRLLEQIKKYHHL